jgi:hypothetical protein
MDILQNKAKPPNNGLHDDVTNRVPKIMLVSQK